MKTLKNKKIIKSGRPKRKAFVITYEILPPGTLKRKHPENETPGERWEGILDICAKIIAENKQ